MNHNTRVNDRIIASRVILILPDGENQGEIPRLSALTTARSLNLDLVEVSGGTIPVCKIMDYGKMLYQKSKQERHQSHAPAPKEIRIKYNTGEADLARQVKRTAEFLSDGHKVMFVMLVKGRERYAGKGIAKEKFISIVKELYPSFKPGDIQENERGFNIVLHPARLDKSPEK